MFPSWRMQIGEARRALRSGQLDRACAIVAQEELRDFRQARELSAELAARFAERARGRMLDGRSNAGWHDLQLAQQMAGADGAVTELRHEYRQQVIQRACTYLAEGRTTAAVDELQKLAARGLVDRRVAEWTEVAHRVGDAEQMLAAGSSAEALKALLQVSESLGSFDPAECGEVAARIARLTEQAQEHQRLNQVLLAATEQAAWDEVLATADRLLSIAPRDRVARAARRKAWKAVGLDATRLYHGGGRAAERPVTSLSLRDTARAKFAVNSTTHADDTMPGNHDPDRFMLWVDAVGGFLVCLDDEVVLGQPAPNATIAVPLCADLSRRHAVIRREGGAYTLDPLGDVMVDGRQLTGPMVLGTRHEIQLGTAVRLKFEKPHALSATARLTPISGHRTEPRADAVLLMADSCVLGPKSHSHVQCRKWPGDVMVFRQQGRLHVRSTMAMTVDGIAAEGATPLAGGARLEGEQFAVSLEDV